VQFDNDSHYAAYYFNHHWLAGGSVRHPGRGFATFAHDAVYSAGSLVFCPLIPAFSSLAAVSLVVWRLSAPLAETPGHAAWRKAACDCSHPHHLRHFIMAGENDVGADPAA